MSETRIKKAVMVRLKPETRFFLEELTKGAKCTKNHVFNTILAWLEVQGIPPSLFKQLLEEKKPNKGE